MEKTYCHSCFQLSLDFGSITEPSRSVGQNNSCPPSDSQQPSAVRFTVIKGGAALNPRPSFLLEPTSEEVTRILRSTVKAIGW